MKSIRILIEELNKELDKLEISEKVRYHESDDESKTAFDSFDWSDIELPPEALPSWIKHELDTHILDGTEDGDIISRRFGDYIYVVKYRNIVERDYIVIAVEKVKKD